MKYVIPDIHGEYFKFIEMLKRINFNSADILYILGDVVDRGKYPTMTLLYIMQQPNIKMILGNHEKMMIDWIHDSSPLNTMHWFQNGGEITANHWFGLNNENRDSITSFLESLPLGYEVDDYVLVHAGTSTADISRLDPKECLRSRDDFYRHPTGIKNKIVLFGHTPTYRINNEARIWYDPVYRDKIDLDCGCGKKGPLSCLRLDDMKEFYVA